MKPGDVVAYLEMCSREGVSLQRGMNYRLHPTHSVFLMSVRDGAPYEDQVTDDGQVLIYEGHDEPRSESIPDPKAVDQPMFTRTRALTQNGLFYTAAKDFVNGEREAERVRVYEKLRQGIWSYAGPFDLQDAWLDNGTGRQVFKFRLSLAPEVDEAASTDPELDHTRVIPTDVKVTVWKRDKGRCVECGAKDNLHFDHIIPYSRGGSSLTPDNIQLLCARHNLAKRDRIQ